MPTPVQGRERRGPSVKAGSFYRTYIRNNLFTKLLATFSAIAVLAIVTLSYLLYAVMAGSIERDIVGNQRRAMESVSGYLTAKNDSVQRMVSDIYQDTALSQNVSYLLQHPFADYFRFRIDRYADEPRAGFGNALTYFERKAEGDADIRHLLLYSSGVQYLYAYRREGNPQLLQLNSALSYIPDAMALETPPVSLPSPWVRSGLGLEDKRLYAVRSAINDSSTLQNIGQLLVYYSSDGIQRALATYADVLKGYLLVLTPQGQVVFDSSGAYYGKLYPYASRISALSPSAELEEASLVSVLPESAAGFNVVSVVPKSEIRAATASVRRTVLSVSAVCILFAVALPSIAVFSVARRTGSLVRLMRRVETGDMAGRIHDPRGDELGQIASGFNRMLDQLDRHIEQEYKAEIRQRNTELSALQARINPHFLSNTLEVIRMRAVSQGADDAGEMIYSLSVLFRSMVSSQSIVPLREELELGRQYLELFRIRYKDRFAYSIEMAGTIGGRGVIKLSLQPIIENYIVHGLDPDRSDNRFSIRAEAVRGMISITLEDNGRGMDDQRLEEVERSMRIPLPDEAEGSFGLHSVSERLRLVYGPEAGLSIASEAGQGTTVIIRFPDELEEERS
ncbi:sensor histidine kinase [Paenibacillus humicus]